MRTPLQVLASVAAFAPLMVLVALAGIYPYRPNSIVAWVVFCLASLPVALALEYTGTHVLSFGFISRLGRFGRIAYGVVVMALLFFAIGACSGIVEPYFGKWGS